MTMSLNFLVALMSACQMDLMAEATTSRRRSLL